MAGITFNELWEDLKNENEESRQFYQTAEDIAKIINRLTEERVRHGLSQRDLAKLCGLKQSAIARMESIKSIPRLDTVLKVADALGVEIQMVEKSRIESITIVTQTGISWFNTSEEKTPYIHKEYGEYKMPAIA